MNPQNIFILIDGLIFEFRLHNFNEMEVYLRKNLNATVPTIITINDALQKASIFSKLHRSSVNGGMRKSFEISDLLKQIDELIKTINKEK